VVALLLRVGAERAAHGLAEVAAGGCCDEAHRLGLILRHAAQVVIEERQRLGRVVEHDADRAPDELDGALGEIVDGPGGRELRHGSSYAVSCVRVQSRWHVPGTAMRVPGAARGPRRCTTAAPAAASTRSRAPAPSTRRAARPGPPACATGRSAA